MALNWKIKQGLRDAFQLLFSLLLAVSLNKLEILYFTLRMLWIVSRDLQHQMMKSDPTNEQM